MVGMDNGGKGRENNRTKDREGGGGALSIHSTNVSECLLAQMLGSDHSRTCI